LTRALNGETHATEGEGNFPLSIGEHVVALPLGERKRISECTT